MNFDEFNEGILALTCEDNSEWIDKISCWVGKESDYNIYVFQAIVDDESDLEKYYEAITASIAMDFQSKLEKSIEKWNIYLVFECKKKISLELKGRIEQDKYSTRKQIWDSLGEHEIGNMNYLKKRLFYLNINVEDNKTSDNISLLEIIKKTDLDLYQTLKSTVIDINQQVAIYLGGNSNEQKD